MKRFILVLTLVCLTSFKGTKVSREELFREVERQGILFPEVTTKIAILESGLKNNNLFGFRLNVKYFTYKTWKESVSYYKKWQERHFDTHLNKYHKTGKPCDYYHFLWARGYVDGKPFSKAGAAYNKKLKNIKL